MKIRRVNERTKFAQFDAFLTQLSITIVLTETYNSAKQPCIIAELEYGREPLYLCRHNVDKLVCLERNSEQDVLEALAERCDGEMLISYDNSIHFQVPRLKA